MKRIAFLWKLVKIDIQVLWSALRHPDRPIWLVPVTALLALYALAPFNLALPFVGLVDDGLIVPLVLHMTIRCLPKPLQRQQY